MDLIQHLLDLDQDSFSFKQKGSHHLAGFVVGEGEHESTTVENLSIIETARTSKSVRIFFYMF